jgi:transposase-like protein
MFITLTCPVCLAFNVEANATGKDGMPNWQTTKIDCENCGAKFEVDLHPKLQNDLTQAVLADKGARIVKLIRQITGCGLKSAFTVHHAFREAISEKPKFPYFAKTRDGHDAIVLNDHGDGIHPIRGVLLPSYLSLSWTTDGYWDGGSMSESPFDLIKE